MNMICLRNHERGADLLVGYLEGSLPEAERVEVDQHASQCTECHGLLSVQTTLDEYEVPEVSLDFDARLYAKIAADSEQSWWSRWMPRLTFAPIMGGSAVLAMTVAVFMMVHGSSSQPGQPVTVGGPVAAQVDAQPAASDGDLKQASVDREIEQLERDLEDVELLMPASKTAKSI
jgi:hypothetical protein